MVCWRGFDQRSGRWVPDGRGVDIDTAVMPCMLQSSIRPDTRFGVRDVELRLQQRCEKPIQVIKG